MVRSGIFGATSTSSRAISVPDRNSRSVKRRVAAVTTVTAGGSTSRGASGSALAVCASHFGRGGRPYLAPHLSSGRSGGSQGRSVHCA